MRAVLMTVIFLAAGIVGLPAQGPAMLIDALVAYPLSAEVRSPVRVSSTHTATTAIIGERGPMP